MNLSWERPEDRVYLPGQDRAVRVDGMRVSGRCRYEEHNDEFGTFEYCQAHEHGFPCAYDRSEELRMMTTEEQRKATAGLWISTGAATTNGPLIMHNITSEGAVVITPTVTTPQNTVTITTI